MSNKEPLDPKFVYPVSVAYALSRGSKPNRITTDAIIGYMVLDWAVRNSKGKAYNWTPRAAYVDGCKSVLGRCGQKQPLFLFTQINEDITDSALVDRRSTDAIDQIDLLDEFEEFYRISTKREKKILDGRRNGSKLTTIAKSIGVSPSRVWQILLKLRVSWERWNKR